MPGINYHHILQAALLMLLAGCNQPARLDAAGLARWVADPGNGLQVKKELNQFELTATWKPTAYVLTHELHEEPADEAELHQRLAELDSMAYLTLRIDSKDRTTEFLKVGASDQQAYFSRLQYFTSLVQNDLYLVQGTDTLPCVFSHLERVYKLSSYGDLLLAFSRKTPGAAGPTTLIYDDHALGLGPVHMAFDTDKLSHVPALKLNEL